MNSVKEGEPQKAQGHTPGPWAVLNDGDDEYAPVVGIEGGKRIADVYQCRTDSEATANARLIAAAPELLAALKLTERWMMSPSIPEGARHAMPIHDVRDAIAKAEAPVSPAEREG